jgi:pentose-5-phosphate-3-epimerase
MSVSPLNCCINPSILSADFVNLEAELARISNAEAVHEDVMDNHFVPNLTIGLPVVERIQGQPRAAGRAPDDFQRRPRGSAVRRPA